MGTRQGVVHRGQRVVAFLAVVAITWATLGCAKPTAPTVLLSEPTLEPNRLTGQVSEVSPPETLESLKQIIDAYTPQVRILSPRPGEILDSTSVAVRVQVRGLPVFQDPAWQLGPHLHVFLDDEPYRAVYDLSEPLVFENLSPGTHTLRVFASRPWHESFKNQGAFDQRTFHVFAQTPQKEVNASAPLLTYSRPQGTYGAEPIMLDFYLTNAPLHLSAQEDPKDDLHDWRIRCTVNGQSFVFDQWQPIYLQGFQPGRNWVQLELIDETGRPIDNRFNNTVRVFDYEPGGDDTLSRLVRGELDLREVASIIDPTYEPPVKVVSPMDKAVEEVEPAIAPNKDDLNPAPLPSTPGLMQEPPDQAQPLDEKTVESPMPVEVLPTPLPLPTDDTPLAPGVAPPSAPRPPDPDAEANPGSEANIAPLGDRPWPKAAPADMGPDQALPGPEPGAALEEEPSPTESLAPTAENRSKEASDFQPVVPPPALPELEGAPPVAPHKQTGAKALKERFKAWQRGARSPAPVSPEAPASPVEPIQVYETPTQTPSEPDAYPAAPAPEMISPPPATVELPRMGPELLEPYLTEPYLTEPHIPLPLVPPSEDQAEDSSTSDGEPQPEAESNPRGPVSPPMTGLKKPYI